MARLKNECIGGGARVGLSAAAAERDTICCDECGRHLKMRKGWAGRTGRSDNGFPETTIPRHNRPKKETP